MAFSAPEGVNSSSEVLGFKFRITRFFLKKKKTTHILNFREAEQLVGGGSTVR